jgi:hypothetical protein
MKFVAFVFVDYILSISQIVGWQTELNVYSRIKSSKFSVCIQKGPTFLGDESADLSKYMLTQTTDRSSLLRLRGGFGFEERGMDLNLE